MREEIKIIVNEQFEYSTYSFCLPVCFTSAQPSDKSRSVKFCGFSLTVTHTDPYARLVELDGCKYYTSEQVSE